MTGNNTQSPEQGAEKAHLKPTEQPPSGTAITNKADNTIQQRLQEREALKTFRLTRDPGNSFGIDMGDGTQVRDKRPLPKDSTDKVSETAIPEKPSDQPVQIEKATASLLKNAEQKYGSDKIQALHIAKDDIGSGLAALALGPEICKRLGKDETHAFGNRLLVFGIAPMFGLADEARKQFTQHPVETAHAGAGNYLSGAAIGALLEHVHPAVLAASIVGGATMFLKDQLSSPEHRARNKEISDISAKIDGASNSEVMAFVGKTKTLLGPDLYKGTFDIVTGTPAIPNGLAVKTAVKEQAVALSKIDVRDGIKVLQDLGHEAWDTIRPLLDQSALKPVLVDGAHNFHPSMLLHQVEQTSKLQDSALRMQSDSSGGSGGALEQLKLSIEKISTKPIADSIDTVIGINNDLLRLSKQPVLSPEQATAVAAIEDKFHAHMKVVQNEVTVLKPQAEAILAKPEQSANDEKLLEKYYAAEDTLYRVVTDRLKVSYGWNEKAGVMLDNAISVKSGMGTQRQVSTDISHLFGSGLDKNPVIKNVLEANGIPLERAKDWVGIPMQGECGADHAGCDYLLANKNTGEIYTIDITEKATGMKAGNLLESRLTNRDLGFADKKVPAERKHLVIGVANDLTRDDLIYNVSKAEKIPKPAAEKIVVQQEQKQLAEIIAQTISRPSKLNIFDTPLPSADPETVASRQAYELWRFKTGLEKIGYADWADSINNAIGYIKSRNPGLPRLK